MTVRSCLAFRLALCLLAGQAIAQDPPIRLLAEAEDFDTGKGAWRVVPYRENYFASTFAISFLSRMGCLGTPEQVEKGQEAVATQAVTIPRADSYQVAVRYEQPYDFSVEFTVEIEQNKKVVYREVFGRLEDPKIWALNGHQRRPMERYWWGGTDNIVWQMPGETQPDRTARLEAGPAVIRLIAGPQMNGNSPRRNAARRHVDVVVLTNDKAGLEAQKQTRYLELDGWLTQAGDLYARFTNPKDGPGPCIPVVSPDPMGQHSPYYIHIRDWAPELVLKKGRVLAPSPAQTLGPRASAVKPSLLLPALDPAATPTNAWTAQRAPNPKAIREGVPESEFLQPGETSGWTPVGQVLDALHNSTWTPQAVYLKDGTDLRLQVEFAIPDGKGGLTSIRTVQIRGREPLEIPGNIAPNPALAKALKERWWLPVIRTQREALAWLKSEVDRFPKKGSTPKRFLIYNIGGFGSTLTFPEGRELALALGDNTAVNQEGKKRSLQAHWRETDMASVQKRPVDDVYVISYGDEMHLPAAPVSNDVFAAWLKARGVPATPPVQWTRDRNDPLFYYSTLCSVENGAAPYIAASAWYKSKGALTGANYSPHANYLVSEMHWVRPFKLNALTMAWSEDYVWQIPEFSVQAVGYMMTAFRCGTKYHRQPIQMYVMPHSPGNTPADFRRAFYTDVGHGMTIANYFCASPLAVGATENYIATDDLPMWREVHAVSHEAGLFEDYVMDGTVRPAKVALLLSSVDDVLTGTSNSALALHNNERKALYYALRHSQVPVDMLTEDDVIDGLAAPYRVLYVTQQWMHSKCLQALRKWTEAGGTVVALCGGGFMDEFNRPNPAAQDFYGVKAQPVTPDPNLVSRYLLEPNRPFLAKQDLPLYEPIDTVSPANQDKPLPIEVIAWKQTLAPGDAQVMGTFADGSPAIVEKPHGKGRAVLFGFLPGQAYLKSGLPVRPPDRGATDSAFAHFLPTAMDARLRHQLVGAFLPSDYLRPVECSEALVESTCIDTPAQGRLAVTLVNYSGKRIDRLTVTIRDLAASKAVRSLERGQVRPEFRDGAMVVDLPLDVADMLLIDR